MSDLEILIVDDHPLFRKGISALLGTYPEMRVVGGAGTADEAVRLASELRPGVILMDLQLPGASGIQAIRDILRQQPEANVLVVTLFEDDSSVFMALRAGARGYVLKDTDEDEMIRAVRAVGNGEAIFSPAIATRVLSFFASPPPAPTSLAFPTLTAREREILGLIAAGESNAAIARALSVSTKTVANHVSNIFGKLQVADRAHAIILARDAGLGGPNE